MDYTSAILFHTDRTNYNFVSTGHGAWGMGHDNGIVPADCGGTADVRSAEPFGKPTLSDCQADLPDNIVYMHSQPLHKFVLAGEFPGTDPECQ